MVYANSTSAPQGTRPPTRMLSPPGPPAPRTTTQLRPPFFHAMTFNSTGATNHGGMGTNSTSCSRRSTFPEGFLWPLINWDRYPELMPARRETSSGYVMSVHALPQHSGLHHGALGGFDLHRGIQHFFHPGLGAGAKALAAPGYVGHESGDHAHPVRQFFHARAHLAVPFPDIAALAIFRDHSALPVDDPFSGDLAQGFHSLFPQLLAPMPVPGRDLREMTVADAHQGSQLLQGEALAPRFGRRESGYRRFL